MRIISNISNITDNSGTAPVVTYSNQVQTVIKKPNIPNNKCLRICSVIICNNPCCNPFNSCDWNMCNHNCGCNNAFNANFANNCSCDCHMCCNNHCNNCNCCGNNCEEIIFHYYCNERNGNF